MAANKWKARRASDAAMWFQVARLIDKRKRSEARLAQCEMYIAEVSAKRKRHEEQRKKEMIAAAKRNRPGGNAP
eukprot:12467659-Heterocapsa_arctica.AAC.1